MAKTGEFTQIASDALKSWSRCKRQFYYKTVKKLQWPADIQHFRLGRDVHKLLDYQARGLNCDLLLQHSLPDVQVSWRKLKDHRLVNLPVVANEWAFHVPIAVKKEQQAGWLTGRIDRVSRDGNRILVIDWKTGTGVPRNPESDWQTMLYLFALAEVAASPSASDLGLGSTSTTFETKDTSQSQSAFCGNSQHPPEGDAPNLFPSQQPALGQKPDDTPTQQAPNDVPSGNTQAGALNPEDVSFVYVEVKADDTTPIREVHLPYSQERHEEIRQLLEKTLSAMADEDEYPTPAECPDRFCAYRPICGVDGLPQRTTPPVDSQALP